jgi:hypothetical protein
LIEFNDEEDVNAASVSIAFAESAILPQSSDVARFLEIRHKTGARASSLVDLLFQAVYLNLNDGHLEFNLEFLL